MQYGDRKSAPKVAGGRVQKKNNWDRSTNYYAAPQLQRVAVDRKRPGVGYKHVLTKRDVYRFLELLPDWDTLAVGLNAVVLAPGRWNYDGYHVPGVVHVCAWETDLWVEYAKEHYDSHRAIFERLGVESEPNADGDYLCKFDEESVRGYQLLHILLHELGHHHDRMTTRSQKQSDRGEKYAEDYALRYEARIWNEYHKAFGR